MTPQQQTPASVVERLNTLWLELNDAHAELPATARILNTLAAAKDEIERLSAEREGLREALDGINELARDRLALIPADLVRGGVVGELLLDILARAALTQGESRQTGTGGWQDIATAPKDGTEFIAYSQDVSGNTGLNPFVSLCAWHPDAGFCTCELRQVTHWMPFTLPAAPTPAEGNGG